MHIHRFKNEPTILIGETGIAADEIGGAELDVRRDLEAAVRSLGYSVQIARDTDDVLSFLRNTDVEVSAVLLDMARPDREGLDLLRQIRAMDARPPVIVVSALSSTPEAVAAMKSGATDFLCKPVARDELARVLNAALDGALAGIPDPAPVARRLPSRGPGAPGICGGSSPRILEIQSRVKQVGWSGVPVVIQGETGTGKEVLARELHAESARAGKPFLKLNCAALPSELVESELFGYERGAFTGAFQKKPGMFELADGGTLLLDEIGDMDVRLQAKLLQVLQDQEFRRVGGRDLVRVDVRVLAATHRDLETAIRAGTFREDLYYRLNVITMCVPPLRERGEDVIRLGEFLIRKYAGPGSAPPAITFNLKQAMLTYDWPGNVRELENYMRKLMIFDDPDVIASELRHRLARRTAQDGPRGGSLAEVDMAGRNHGVPRLEQVTQVNRRAESDAILSALNSTHWNRKQAAMILKVDYKSLLYKMKKLGIDDSPALVPERLALPSGTSLAANGD